MKFIDENEEIEDCNDSLEENDLRKLVKRDSGVVNPSGSLRKIDNSSLKPGALFRIMIALVNIFSAAFVVFILYKVVPGAENRNDIEASKGLHWSMTTLVSLFSAGFVTFILNNILPGAGFFSIHPICMTIAYGFLMFQAVMLLSSSSLFSVKKRMTKVTLHWSIQVTSLLLSCIGFGVVYYNKYDRNKEHFTTWHGWFGLATLIMTVLQCIGGVMAKYPSLMKKYQHPLTIKALHAFAAIITFSLTAFALITGLQSNYFSNLTKDTTSLWRLAIAVPPIMTLFVVLHVVQSYLPRYQNKI